MSDREFRVFRDKGGPGRGSIENPTVRVTSRKIHLGSAIHREIFDESDRIEFLIDAENAVVGLRPIEADAGEKSHAYSAGGSDVSCRSVWLEMGVEIGESHEVPLDTESEAFPTIDVSEFIGGDPHTEDDAEEFACEVCGDVFDSERGRNIHAGRVHSDEDDEDQQQGESDDQGQEDEQPDLPYECPVQDCAKRFAEQADMRAHRDDAHDETEIKRAYREQVREDLPSHVSIVDVEATAAGSSNLYEMTEELRMPRGALKAMIGKLGLGDVLDEHGEAQACHLVEDLHDELGIDEPLPDVPGEAAGGEAA